MKKRNSVLLIFMLVAFFSDVQAQTLSQLSGKIVDERDAPIPGASIRLLNTAKAALSDSRGEFTLRNVESGSYTVQISAVGFATTTTQTAVNAATVQQTFVLPGTNRVLEQVV